MKHRYRRIFSAVLAVLFLILLVPPASAAEPEGASEEPETASSTVTITAKNDFYIGYTEFFYHQYISGDYYPVGPYFTENAAYYSMENGGYAFCVQPSKHGETGEHIQTEWNKYIDTEAMVGIGRALCYGAPNNGDTSEDALKATALLIWDIATGYRNADGTARSRDAIGAITPPFYKAASGYVKVKYNQILEKMKNHNKIPSFAVPTESLLSDANKILLQFNEETGLYEASVTDTNEILADYNYTSNIPGLIFTREENTLHISATEEAAAQLGGGLNFFARGHCYEVTDKTALVWSSAANENSQQLTTLPAEVDPVPAFIRLETPVEVQSVIKIVKALEISGPLEGWIFKVTDSTGQEIPGSPFTTEADGTIFTGNLLPGEYTVEELLPEDSLYTCLSQNPQVVSVIPGQTTEAVFINTLRSGSISVRKVDASGNPLAGATFFLEWSEEGVNWQPVNYMESGPVVKGYSSALGIAEGLLTSDESGWVVFSGLHPNCFYRVTEVAAPEGHQLTIAPVFLGILPPEKDLSVSITAADGAVFMLPFTGTYDMLWLSLGLSLSITVMGSALLILRRKEQ